MVRTLPIIFLTIASLWATASAQDPPLAPDTAPPPMKAIPRPERIQIDAADDPKSRLKLTITLAETHLTSAEAANTRSDYPAASAAVGRYWALLEDAFGFLRTMKLDSNKTRDLYKRLELTLRAHGPRLVAMRRSTPAEYSMWIKEVEEFAREGRTEALNSFYGHTVFREPKAKSTLKPEGVQPQKALNAAEAKKP
ncbi:MAG TPA: hypothetical protein VJU86_00150 [Pyrinomonadaceae bacterium]|nr:hypothetical protein [Pyrinomonadaceae bacterium]